MTDRLLKALLGALTVVLIAVIGVGVYLLQNDKGHFTINPQPTVSPTPSATPTSSTVAVMRVPIPADSSCKDCHTAGAVSVPDVPVMAHPLTGWNNCTACHGTKKLVATAPGHRGIHRETCLMCHQPLSDAAIKALPRQHKLYPGKQCIDCHTPGGSAPLPHTMDGRKNCWICHVSAKNQDLFADSSTVS